MTNQILMPSSLSDLPSPQTVAHQPQSMSDTASSSGSSSNSVCLLEANRLPYRATHRDELLYLQAETEALLQLLQTLKQQRQALVSLTDQAEITEVLEARAPGTEL